MQRQALWNRLYLSGIDGRAADLARENGLGLEIAAFCYAPNLEDPAVLSAVRADMAGLHRFWLHAPFAELCPCAIDPLVRQVTEKRYRQAADMARPDGLVLPFAACYRYLRELLPEYGTLGREAAELSRVLENGSRAARQQEQRPAAFAPLTEREWAVAQRMARRLSNREIAGQLFLSEGTVKQYINQIYSKLHLTGDARTKRRRLEELMED